MQVRTLAVLFAAGAMALSAGFAANHFLREEALLSSEADVAGLMSTPLPDLGGQPTTIAKWRGQVLVVNFWATWCTPCREEIPDFIRLQKELGGRGVQFVGIAADDAVKVGVFSREFGINYPTLVGGYASLDLAKRLGNKSSALPFTVIIDRRGNLIHRQLGLLKPEKLKAIVDELL